MLSKDYGRDLVCREPRRDYPKITHLLQTWVQSRYAAPWHHVLLLGRPKRKWFAMFSQDPSVFFFEESIDDVRWGHHDASDFSTMIAHPAGSTACAECCNTTLEFILPHRLGFHSNRCNEAWSTSWGLLIGSRAFYNGPPDTRAFKTIATNTRSVTTSLYHFH